jgi:hypothetical protein
MIKDSKEYKKYLKKEKLKAQMEALKQYKKTSSKIINKTSPDLNSKMSYKSGNPLKGLLKSKKKTTIKLHGGESINLMKAEW